VHFEFILFLLMVVDFIWFSLRYAADKGMDAFWRGIIQNNKAPFPETSGI